MKKGIWIMILVVFVSGVTLVSAEEMKGMMDKADKGGMMGEGGKMGMGKGMMMSMHGMMMQMAEKSVVATPDGGVIIVSFNKIVKYDKDLNFVKEVELKTDVDGMSKMMVEMMEKCPIMGKGMMGGAAKQTKEKALGSEAVASPELDHASHH